MPFPKAGALTGLRHAPKFQTAKYNIFKIKINIFFTSLGHDPVIYSGRLCEATLFEKRIPGAVSRNR